MLTQKENTPTQMGQNNHNLKRDINKKLKQNNIFLAGEWLDPKKNLSLKAKILICQQFSIITTFQPMSFLVSLLLLHKIVFNWVIIPR